MTNQGRGRAFTRRVGFAGLLALSGLVGDQLFAGDHRPPIQDMGVKERLAEASRIQRDARGKKGSERSDILLKAAEVYDSVLKDFPAEKAAAQEGQFRAGGIYRSLARIDDARARYDKCVELAATRSFTARAMLELGHLARRQSDSNEALKWYERTAKEFAELLPYRDDAHIWAGKTLDRQGNHAKAREYWQVVAEGGESITDRIQAYDLIGQSYASEDNREQATATLAACDEAFGAQAKEDTREGQRIASALERMRLRKVLEQTDN